MEIKLEPNQRGFPTGEFLDRYDNVCSIQKSSLAGEDCIWLGVDLVEPKIMAIHADKYGIKTDQPNGWVEYPIPKDVSINTRMHLNREQVAALLPILQRFVETGEI